MGNRHDLPYRHCRGDCMRAEITITVDKSKMFIETIGVTGKENILLMLAEATKLVSQVEPKIKRLPVKPEGTGNED